MQTQTATTATDNAVVNALSTVLADSYALFGQTHVAHWNVEGKSFFSLHNAFEEQYNDLFTAIDDIAERIRALDSLAPGGLATLAKMSDIEELAIEPMPANDYVAHLIEGHEIATKHLKKLRDVSEEQSDMETQDMAIARIQVHEKTTWMLKSFIKNL